MYYNADEILSRNHNLNFICGDRNAGKSTCFQKYVIKRAIEYFNEKNGGSQFAVLTRYDKDKKTLCETYFNNTMEMFYKDYELIYKRRTFYLKNLKTEQSKIVGYAFALNEATKLKSTSYPHINSIIFEEFLNLENKFIKNQENPLLEVELLLSLYSTIARGNGKQIRTEVKLFLIANCYYINNPYFKYFDFIQDIVKNPFKRFYTKNNEQIKAIIEMTHNDIYLDFAKKSINKGGKFSDLENEINIIENPIVKANKVVMQLTFDNNNFVNIIPYNDSFLITSTNTQNKDCIVFSTNNIKRKGIYDFIGFKNTKQYKLLCDNFNNNWLYYDKYDTFITFYNFMNF